MAVIELELNREEEKMVTFLSDYYDRDDSELIKYSLKELYEDIVDRKVIANFEEREKSGKITFIDSDKIFS